MNLGLAFMAPLVLSCNCRGSEGTGRSTLPCGGIIRIRFEGFALTRRNEKPRSARTPTLLWKTYSKPYGLASASRARTYGERQANAVAFALAGVAGISREGPDQFQSESAHGLLRDQHRGVQGTKLAKRIVWRRRVLVAQSKTGVAGLESDPHGRLTLLAISVSYGIRE